MGWVGVMGTTQSPEPGAREDDGQLVCSMDAPRRRPPEEITVCINNLAKSLKSLCDPWDWNCAELPFISKPLPALLRSLEVIFK